jgi:biopolymer transport protein ExbB
VRRFSWQQGVDLLRRHARLDKARRDEVMGIWLMEVRHYLQRRLRLLQLIGVLSPMLGLVRTVLALLAMFSGIAGSDRAVTPSVLADGLFQALYSTAWGLSVAIAALGGGQALELLGGSYVARLQQLLNRCLLALDDIVEQPYGSRCEAA